MLLARALDMDEGAVRADLQRFYGIDLDDAMAGAHSAGHVAALIAHLPSDASVYRANDADAAWTLETSLLALIFNLLQAAIYAAGDPRGRGKRPDFIGPSWMSGNRKAQARAMTIDQLMAELSKPRR